MLIARPISRKTIVVIRKAMNSQTVSIASSALALAARRPRLPKTSPQATVARMPDWSRRSASR